MLLLHWNGLDDKHIDEIGFTCTNKDLSAKNRFKCEELEMYERRVKRWQMDDTNVE